MRRRRMVRTVLVVMSLCALLWQTPMILERVETAVSGAALSGEVQHALGHAAAAKRGGDDAGTSKDGVLVFSRGRRLAPEDVARMEPAIRSTTPKVVVSRGEPGGEGEGGSEEAPAQAPSTNPLDAEAAERIMELAKSLAKEAKEEGEPGGG